MIRLPMIAPGEISPLVVARTEEIDRLLAANAPVAIGVSGGKDSSAVAIATNDYLDRIGHHGERLLIHSDLGLVEWSDSLRVCEELARDLSLPLAIVYRKQGGMVERWEQRWGDNLERWLSLSCVKMILPWSTPAMRFCTAELKVDQITRYLKRRWPGQRIVSVTGIRRQESRDRKNAPICGEQPKLKGADTTGVNWNPIAEWDLDEMLHYLATKGARLHEAYTKFKARRVSCVYCILATEADHRISASDSRNLAIGERMVRLECDSFFAFQGDRWLGDTLRDHLDSTMLSRVRNAKECAKYRELVEARIPDELLYHKGWPTRVPDRDEAALLADVRQAVSKLYAVENRFPSPGSIRVRYAELLQLKAERDRKKRRK